MQELDSVLGRRSSRPFLLAMSLMLLAIPAMAQLPLPGRTPSEGVPGLTVTIKQPKSIVLQAVQQTVDDGVIHGTWMYEREKILKGAHAAKDSAILHGSEGAEKTFYKVAESVVAPRFFKGSADVGNITVRYLVQDAGSGTTRLQVDALFTEYGRKKTHASTGVVEAAEYQSIEKELEAIQAIQSQRQAELSSVSNSADTLVEASPAPSSLRAATYGTAADVRPTAQEPLPGNELTELQLKISDLKHKVEMRVKPGQAALKSAPFNSSATLAPLSGGGEVLILIITPHWYGIETEAGQHGWVHGSQLEPIH